MLNRLIDRWFIKKPALRRAVTRLLEGDRECDISLLGSTLRVHSIKEHGYLRASRNALRQSVFGDETGVLISLSMLLRDGDTFVDVGANVGLFMAVLSRARQVWSQLRFYAFEANPDTYQRLCRTVEKLGVHTHQVAVSDHKGELEFVEGAVSHVFAVSEHQTAYNLPENRRAIPCDRLDHFDIEGDSLIIKIDVEGVEYEALAGAKGFFEQDRVKAVYVDGYENPAVGPFLAAYGFEFFDGRTLQATPDAPGYSLLAIKRSKLPAAAHHGA